MALNIKHTVKNCDRQDILFSLGAHPGFATPHIDDFEIQFEKEEDVYYLTKDGLLDNSQKIMFREKRLSLTPDLFSNDALIFKKVKSNHIDLINKAHNQVIRVGAKHMPYWGIWGKENISFVCIEPWYGVADPMDHDQNIEKKEGIIRLAENQEFVFSYSIETFHA